MKQKSVEAVSVIGGADGPTSVFIASKQQKLTLKQKFQKKRYALIPELTDESEEGIRTYLQDLGNREKALRKFRKIYRDVYRYYGVTQKDIETKSERYEDLVRTLTK